MHFWNGMNRRDFDVEWCRNGGYIDPVRGTGEIRYFHPAVGWSGKVNARRKDATRDVVAIGRRLARVLKPHEEAAA